MRVLGTGVRIRLADPQEVEAVDRSRRGLPPFDEDRSYEMDSSRSAGSDECHVVAACFVEIEHDGERRRWSGIDHIGAVVSTQRDATLELLALARDTQHDLIDELADMGIAGLPVTRWMLVSAPHRIELDPELESALAPLRRR